SRAALSLAAQARGPAVDHRRTDRAGGSPRQARLHLDRAGRARPPDVARRAGLAANWTLAALPPLSGTLAGAADGACDLPGAAAATAPQRPWATGERPGRGHAGRRCADSRPARADHLARRGRLEVD